MREVRKWAGLTLVGATLLTGCAAQKVPCTLIPAQLELAQTQRDKAKTLYDQKKEDVDRQRSNNDVSMERMVSLTQERDELRAQYGSPADTTKGGN